MTGKNWVSFSLLLFDHDDEMILVFSSSKIKQYPKWLVTLSFSQSVVEWTLQWIFRMLFFSQKIPTNMTTKITNNQNSDQTRKKENVSWDINSTNHHQQLYRDSFWVLLLLLIFHIFFICRFLIIHIHSNNSSHSFRIHSLFSCVMMMICRFNKETRKK